MNALKPWHLIVLLLVIVVLFGANRLPDVARSLARSLKIFKNELTDGEEKKGSGPVSGEVVDPPAQRTEQPPAPRDDRS